MRTNILSLAVAVTVLLLLLVIDSAMGIRVLLTPKRGAECFYESIDGASAEIEIRFRWEIVESQKYEEAIATLESPSRVEIYNSGSSVHGHHESRAIESGQYKVCFMVAPVAIATGKKTFNVQFYWDILPQGSQLYAHEVSANSVVNLQSPEHVTTPSVWNPKESTTLDISPTPNLQVAALRFDLSQVFKPEDLALILETSMHASVRLHIAYAEKPNAMCRLISPRRSKKDDPLASALADGSNLKRTPRGMTGSGGWYGYRWDEASFRWDDVPLSLTLLDSQRCHTNHTLEFNITDEFLGAVQSVHELVNDKLRAVSVVDAVANLQMTVFVVSDAQLVKVVSHHTNNPIVTRPQLLIQVADDSLNSAVAELSRNLFRFKTSQTYARIRERALRDTTESTNARTQWFKVMLCGFLAAVAALQILYLKSLIEPKSGLERFSAAPPSSGSGSQRAI